MQIAAAVIILSRETSGLRYPEVAIWEVTDSLCWGTRASGVIVHNPLAIKEGPVSLFLSIRNVSVWIRSKIEFESSTPLLFLSSFPASPHQAAQIIIDSGLISFPGAPQPSQNIRINPDGYAGLLGPIEPADDCVEWYIADFGDVGKVDLAVRSGSEPLEFFPFFSR